MTNSLIADVRSSQNLFSAWRHVRKSALNSSNDKIKGSASEFEFRHQSHIRKIQEKLRQKDYNFGKSYGVLKDAKARIAQNKSPRPIVIATLEDRIVQRAILQVLQPRRVIDSSNISSRFSTTTDPRLGKLNQVNTSTFGVGGLMKPYGGSTPAIKLLYQAMNSGCTHYYKSDIKAFFTAIPQKNVLETILKETGDVELTRLFDSCLKVELSNEKDIVKYKDIFPSNGIGVAQGSSLSALAGNILLYNLDNEINTMGVLCVRYIDDVVILGPDKDTVELAKTKLAEGLKDFGFSLYAPVKGSDKAEEGLCAKGFGCLGYWCHPSYIEPSKKSQDNLLDRISSSLSHSKMEMQSFIRDNKALSRDASMSSTLHKVQLRTYGWQKSFAMTTRPATITNLDKKISEKVNDYVGWVLRTSRTLSKSDRACVIGVPPMRSSYVPPVFD